MGRPIKSKFFGNRNSPYDNEQTGGTSGIGGETVNAIVVSNTGTAYSAGSVVTIGAPNVAGGVQATISYSRNSAGSLSVSLVNGGSGYTSAPTVAVTTASAVVSVTTGSTATTVIYPASTSGIYVGMEVIGTGISASATYVTSVVGNAVNLTWPNSGPVSGPVITLDTGASFAATAPTTTSTFQNGIAFTSFLLAKDNGANAVSGGDILKQESSRRYLVKNSEGIGQVKLVATDAITAGGMTIIATDGSGATFFVEKLTAHKATVVSRTSTSTASVVSGTAVGWTLGAATGTNQVTIASL